MIKVGVRVGGTAVGVMLGVFVRVSVGDFVSVGVVVCPFVSSE